MAFAAHKGFKLYQMDVKSAFLNGHLKEEVYLKQPPGFIHEKYPHYVYKLKKSVYGLRQSPRCWYERLSQFLLKNGFTCGLQINQSAAGIFIHQSKYVNDLFKRFVLENISAKATPMSTTVKLTKDDQGTPVDITKYRDADYAGSQVDRKSTSGACEYLGDCLVAWHSKKQTSVALSTAEGEYIAAGSCCAQILWMQQTLQDFGISYTNIPIYCDNTSAINISKNPVMHSRTKHIDEDMVYSEVQGVPIVFNANLLSRVCGISCSGVCPYTTHAAFMEFPGLQYEEQLKVNLGENFIGTSLKPMVHDLTPLALLLFKLFHTNLLPRKSGRDRVTYQDVVLISVFMTKTPCDIASLIIKYMSHCASHESMNLSFPALLTKIFRHFSIVSDDDNTEPVSTMFDLAVLSANNIEIIESGVLIFGEGHKSFGSFPESPHYMSDPDQEDSVLLKSLLSKVSKSNNLLESLRTQFASIESLASLTSQVSMMRASYEMFNKSVTASLESINAKLEILHVHDKKVSRAIDFEFGALHEGMVTTTKAWEEEFVKLFYKLGTETKYISQQVSTRSMPWHQKKDWLGDMTLAEVTSPSPLPAVPPPEAFGKLQMKASWTSCYPRRKLKGDMVMTTKERYTPKMRNTAQDASAVVEKGDEARKMVNKEDNYKKVAKSSKSDKYASEESLGGHQHHVNNQDQLSKEEVEAAEREVMKLMRRDYRNKPRRRPPIHNNKPNN
ncbi:hypothetical protein AgCh_012399 [Apium graveolens]